MKAVACLLCKENMCDPWHIMDGQGILVYVHCKQCRDAFKHLPGPMKKRYTQTALHATFSPGQVVYGQYDPRTNQLRYIGRTNDIERRKKEHRKNRSAKLWEHTMPDGRVISRYTRANWAYELHELGLQPITRILREVTPGPRIVEWEHRFIWHHLQAGADLLNWLHISREKALQSPVNFLTAPMSDLLELGFFSSQSIAALVEKSF